MAVTKIKPIRSTLKKSIDYITNANKTDDFVYVDSFACSPETAHLEFTWTASKGSGNGKVLAYHIIQSFVPEETTPEQAHELGKEFARQITGGKYEYVIATHVDKKHIHNHIIMNATDFQEYKKYHSNYQSYRQLRNTSDQLCEKYGLSVIKQPQQKGMHYLTWLSKKREQFTSKRLSITATSVSTNSSQHIGLLKTIENQISNPFAAQRMAKIELEKLNKTYLYLREHQIESAEELSSVLKDASKELSSLHSKIHELESQIKPYEEYLKYAATYSQLKPIYQQYIKLGKDSKFYRAHRREIILFEQADFTLRSNPLAKGSSKPKLSQIRKQRKEMQTEIDNLYQNYSNKKKEIKKMQTVQKNVEAVLSQNQQLSPRTKEKNLQ